MNKQSRENLETCESRLVELFTIVDHYIPCRVTEGFRCKEKQDEYFNAGKTKVQWPNGKHNYIPSLAVDVIPEPVDYEDTKKLHFFAGFVFAMAVVHNIPIRWGGDWDGDKILGEPNDAWDKPHFEIKE